MIMTKTSEFIEQATIANQRRLEQYKRDLEYYKKESGLLIDYGAKIFHLKNDIKHIEETVLPNLKQIKCELEAWEVVKKHCDYQDGDPFDCIPEGFYIIEPIRGKDFLIVKKALGEENE